MVQDELSVPLNFVTETETQTEIYRTFSHSIQSI